MVPYASEARQFLSQYGVSRERGFLLPDCDPLEAFPDERLAGWDRVASLLPGLCAAAGVERAVAELPPIDPEIIDAASTPALERLNLVVSFLAHALVWFDGGSAIPPILADPWIRVASRLGRPPILTYYSYNACNWRRLDRRKGIELGNVCRLLNFAGGLDEEWFSMVHVAIEAQAGVAIDACVRARIAARADDDRAVAAALGDLGATLRAMVATLNRMREGCDPYIYNRRVRIPMAGFTEMPYGDDERRTYLGETGAQSSVIPAIDAAIGLRCDDVGGVDGADALVPYLVTMRDYMPPRHAALIANLEQDDLDLRAFCRRRGGGGGWRKRKTASAFDDALSALVDFRALHLGLAHAYVRQWDDRTDDQVTGTGGTLFMPYLRAHRDATKQHAINDADLLF
ncbi:hypothetical protein CTAYLR_000004 [Chrysophaeum taylorii]|uniref:Indoleamine 2,3-dioxygenase n=1 Tax=Chrysophaeum taylorii TaxID=2483200 RepID=A0AAD7UGE4_9STRA|nr:hypothetical protein CTAYLR_000004 [Chrysophaeum taylorii]